MGVTFSDDAVRMPWGKYRGWELGQIAADDPLYLDWLVDCDALKNARSANLKRAVTNVCERYAREIAAAIEARDNG